MLELTSVSRNFGKLAAISDVTFQIKENTIHGLIGPNGSGKTTMFNLISGFLRPSSGTIRLDGKLLNGKRPHQIAALGITRTFQLTSSYGEYSVLENVEIGHHLRRNIGEAAIRKSALEIIDRMGIGEHRDTPAKILPAGTQRTLAIATAMASTPKFLLLDEPLAGLHPTEKAKVASKIADLKDSGITIFIVEHDVKSVFRICSHITVINFGEMIANGTPDEVRTNRNVIEAYLGDGH